MKWRINLENLSHGGFAPLWFKETYPSFGNKNQAGAMVNIDMTNPGIITQGPGLSTLTNGTEAGAVTTLINQIIDLPSQSTSFAVGGTKVYEVTSTAVTNSGNWPITIDKAAVTGESGQSICLYKNNVYYSYSHSGNAGDIGKVSVAGTGNDVDYMSTVPSGAATLTDNGTSPISHQMIVGGNAMMYIANSYYVASFDGTTFIPQALDFSSTDQITSLAWCSDRLYIAAFRDNAASLGFYKSSIFLWDGTTDSWETEIPVAGKIGGLFVKNGTVFFFYQSAGDSTVYKMAYLNGGSVVDLCSFQGGLPSYSQITDYKDFIIFNAGGLIYAFGSNHPDIPMRLYQFADGGYSTVGAVSNGGGTVLIASNQSTSYKVATFSGYDVTCSWKSLLFDITGNGKTPRIDEIRVNFEQLATGASVALALKDNQGRTIYSDTISYSKLGAATTVWLPVNGKVTENFRVELDFAAGSTTNPVKIKNIRINGSTE